ncbi:MAG: 30S ribosomal protein S13 [Candidatus Woesearchaeota archaeon]
MEPNFKHIVRIINTDLNGNKQILYALRKIKGVNTVMANAILFAAGIAKDKRTGLLSDMEIRTIDDVLKNPAKHNLPSWLYNRRKDPETGNDRYLVGTDVAFVKDNDIKKMKMIRCYKGFRHMAGLPARGQRTKANFRRTKSRGKGGSLGVVKRAGAKQGRG